MNYNDEQIEDESDIVISMVNNSRYSTNFHVSKHYFGSIMGRHGATKMRIEKDTGTIIKIPRQGEEGDIYIIGINESDVIAARRRVNTIIISTRMKQRPTHFNCIPMTSPEIIKNFEVFKEKVLTECSSSRGLEELIFIRAEKLHLSLGIICLLDKEEMLAGSKLFAKAKDTVIMPLLREHLPLKIRLKGLSSMSDDPTQMSVLYGMVSEESLTGTGLLQKLGDSLVEHYYKAGYRDRHYGKGVTLHVTLINTRYRNESSGNEKESAPDRRRPKDTFDGSDILKKFEDFDFGVVELKEIHLSQMGDIGEDGFYKATCVVSCA